MIGKTSQVERRKTELVVYPDSDPVTANVIPRPKLTCKEVPEC